MRFRGLGRVRLLPLYDFSGTYVVGISSPYEVQGFADYTTPFEETPSTYFAVNGFDIAGDEKAGIFFTPLPLAFPNSQLFPLADPGGAAFTMETGIDVPYPILWSSRSTKNIHH